MPPYACQHSGVLLQLLTGCRLADFAVARGFAVASSPPAKPAHMTRQLLQAYLKLPSIAVADVCQPVTLVMKHTLCAAC
jgi:hypothetical protein